MYEVFTSRYPMPSSFHCGRFCYGSSWFLFFFSSIIPFFFHSLSVLLALAVSSFGIKIHFIIRVSAVRCLPADAALSDRVEIVMRFSVLGWFFFAHFFRRVSSNFPVICSRSMYAGRRAGVCLFNLWNLSATRISGKLYAFSSCPRIAVVKLYNCGKCTRSFITRN